MTKKLNKYLNIKTWFFDFINKKKIIYHINVAIKALTLLKSSETKTLQLSISKFPKKIHVQNNILQIFKYETCYSDNFKTLALLVFFKRNSQIERKV